MVQFYGMEMANMSYLKKSDINGRIFVQFSNLKPYNLVKAKFPG